MSTRQTNAEWLSTLPEPYRMKALNNAERLDVLGVKVESLAAALCAFPWELTAEGYYFWKDVYDKVQKRIFN